MASDMPLALVSFSLPSLRLITSFTCEFLAATIASSVMASDRTLILKGVVGNVFAILAVTLAVCGMWTKLANWQNRG